MQLILLKDVKGLGKAGQVVEASDGYARNMLIPKKLAMKATGANLAELEKNRQEIEARRALDKQVAEEIKAKLEAATITIHAKGGDNGRLFGAVTSQDIADAIEKDFKLKLDKKKIDLSAPIKQAGTHQVEFKLFQGISAKCNVSVIAE